MTSPTRSFAFISTLDREPWGGCEQLWHATALRLHGDGERTRANVIAWTPPHAKIQALLDAGVDVGMRQGEYSKVRRAVRMLTRDKRTLQTIDLERWLERDPPGLTVINHVLGFPPVEMLEMLARRGWNFATVTHVNDEYWWYDDQDVTRWRAAVAPAKKNFFVSNANLRITRRQFGLELADAEVIRNTYDADHARALPWPLADANESLSLACVGRLDPASKGHDLLFDVLSGERWRARAWTLNIYGDGARRGVVKRMAEEAGLGDRVRFCGYRSVNEIWAENHVLALPSRAEGLPIVIIEAMLCGRPCVVTNVGGSAEPIDDNVTGFVADAPTVRQIGEAMERMWSRRGDLQTMGQAAASAVRAFTPADPAGVFADRLRALHDDAPKA